MAKAILENFEQILNLSGGDHPLVLKITEAVSSTVDTFIKGVQHEGRLSEGELGSFFFTITPDPANAGLINCVGNGHLEQRPQLLNGCLEVAEVFDFKATYEVNRHNGLLSVNLIKIDLT